MKNFSPKHLAFALWLRKKIRQFSTNPKNCQRGTIKGYISGFLDKLLDITHQETFTHTMENGYAQDDIEKLSGFHVPKI